MKALDTTSSIRRPGNCSIANAAPAGIANTAEMSVADRLTRNDNAMMVIKSLSPEKIRLSAVVKISMRFASPCGGSPLALLRVMDKLGPNRAGAQPEIRGFDKMSVTQAEVLDALKVLKLQDGRDIVSADFVRALMIEGTPILFGRVNQLVHANGNILVKVVEILPPKR